ncbi:MAG: glycosyltransferase family 1 protein [Anaerolineales bacterium]
MVGIKNSNTLTVGLIGYGSKDWIAGVNYISSLMYANSLQSQTQQQTFHLFLHEHLSDETDYEDISQHTKSVELFDFSYGTTFSLLNRLRHFLRETWLQRKFPHSIKNNLPKLLQNTKCQIVFPANQILSNSPSSVKTISWIPDFQYKYFPEYFPNPARINYKIKRILRLSDLVIVSNECSKKDVQKYFPEFIHKIRLMPFTMWLGSEWKAQDYESVIQKYNLPRKYLIFPSQFWVHKNHLCLFDAIATVKQRGHTNISLVCTGYPHDNRNPSYSQDLASYIECHGLQESIHILGFLPRYDQIQLIRGSAAVVQPSLFEGYSAIIDEAQSLGKEIFVSDIPMHREMQVEKTIFFDPYYPGDLAEKLESGWPNLNPGPDFYAESLSLRNYNKRMRAFGKRFREICYSVI